MPSADIPTILLLSFSDAGQSNSMLALARELQQRKHYSIAYASFAPVKSKLEKAAPGARFYNMGEFVNLSERFAIDPELYNTWRAKPCSPEIWTKWADYMFESPQDYGRYTKMILEIISEVKPVIAVCDILFAVGLDATAKAGIPTIVNNPGYPAASGELDFFKFPFCSTGLSYPMTDAGRQKNLALLGGLKETLSKNMTILQIEGVRKALDIPNVPVPYFGARKHQLAYIYHSLRELDLPWDNPTNSHYVGSATPGGAIAEAFTTPSEAKTWKAILSSGKPIVYINMATMFVHTNEDVKEFTKAVTQLASQGIAIVWKLRAKESFASLLPAPSEHVIVTDWIDDTHAILSNASTKVIVHHGGQNTLHEAAYYGIPQMILSQWTDTHDLAQRAMEAGIGLASSNPPAIDGDEVVQGVHKLLEDPKFAQRAQELAAISKQAGGATKAVNIIEDMAAQQASK